MCDFAHVILSLSLMFLPCVHIVMCVSTAFHCMSILHFVHLLMDICIVSTLGALKTILLRTFKCKFLCGYVFSFHQCIYLGVKLLGHMVTMFDVFEKLQIIFQRKSTILYSSPTVYEGSNFFASSPVFVVICFLDNSHPGGCAVVSHCGFDLHFPKDVGGCRWWLSW